MNILAGFAHRCKPWLFATVLLFLVSLGIVESFQGTTAQAKSAAVTYSNGVLHVTIPYQAPHAGAGQLTVEILNPEDEVLGRVRRHVTVSDAAGTWQDEIKLAKALAVEDLVWHRLRYGFVYSGSTANAVEGTESISQILRMPVIHVLGQQSYLAGGQAAVRVIVTDSNNETIAGGGSVRIEWPDSEAEMERAVRRPAEPARHHRGAVPLPGGRGGHVTRCGTWWTRPSGRRSPPKQVRLEDKVSILLTTEKPLYQPGQTIHARALALDRADHQAAAGRKLTFEVEDSRGNKVFKKATQTDAFGIASAEFGLADEVNLGTYHLRALMDATNTSELALNVERYVLPKFKVAVEFAGNGNEAKHGYRPGDHVTGTVRANYFFGKPVDGGRDHGESVRHGRGAV